MAQLELWRKRERGAKNFLSDAESKAIQDLYAVKLAQIEQEHAEKIAANIQEHWDNYADIEYGLTQSLEDEIFDMENSQYEADKRRALQKAQKALDEGVDAATVQRYLSDKFGQLDKKARESREKDDDYTKKPKTALPVDNVKIVDLYNQFADNNTRRAKIGTEVDETRIRAQLSPLLSDEARYLTELNQATHDLTDAQDNLKNSPANLPQNNAQTTEADVPRQQPVEQENILSGLLSLATAKGTIDEQPDERLKPYVETDLSGLVAPLTAIDQKFDALLQSLQRETADNSFAYLGDILSEKLGALPNIERYAQEISQSIQTIAFPTEVIITPLNNINGIVAQILSALQNREPPTVTVSPNIDINLGGAYVFDDALKKALVNDITSDVVVSIKDAVQQATRKSNYGFSA